MHVSSERGNQVSEQESNAIRDREAREAAPHLQKARETKRCVSFMASDGCEVTCTPDGRTLFNATDWY
jgi:hypothetical protein